MAVRNASNANDMLPDLKDKVAHDRAAFSKALGGPPSDCAADCIADSAL